MNIIISSPKYDLAGKDKDYAVEKFSHLERIHNLDTLEARFSEANNKISCEVKMLAPRAEPIVLSLDAEHAREVIDLLIEKCERQLRRLKEKKEDKRYVSGQ
ncbi:MAG: HPF/RaiA family ribosome-associated protein [Planctomycetota bacterium]|jgi:ribosomal subunit interface protein|nr:HPF/RaiA family ribosome-associated protein [Planctomycetota bacterium]